MSTLGLKNSLRSKILEPFWKYRGDETTQGPGVPITLMEFIATRPDGGEVFKNAAGQPLGWNDLYVAMGRGPYETYLNALTAREDDFRFLASVLIEEMAIKGYTQADLSATSWWQLLCYAIGVPAANEAIKKTFPQWIGEPKPTGEGENLPIVSIRSGEESLAWKKKGCMIMFSLEYLMVHPVPVLEGIVAEQTRVLQFQECTHAAQTLVNGDTANGANASPVVGVYSTQDGIKGKDFRRMWARGGLLGRRWYTMLSGEDMGVTIEELDEFALRQVGVSQIGLNKVNRPVPQNMDHFMTEEVPANCTQLVDTDRCMRQRVFLPLHVEGARKPENLTQGVAIATSTTYEITDDMARVQVDQSKAFETYGFPAWFKLGGSRL